MSKFIRIAGGSLLPLPATPEPTPDAPLGWPFHALPIARTGKRWRVDSASNALPNGFVRWCKRNGFAVEEASRPTPGAVRSILLERSKGGGAMTSEHPRSRGPAVNHRGH